MSDPDVIQDPNLRLWDLEEDIARWREQLEQTAHPDLQEQLRAQLREARAEVARLTGQEPPALR